MRLSDLAAAALAALLPVAAAGAPARVVSMNLCTDQLALMLAAPGQLVSVSHVAFDPNTSVMVEAARGLPANRGQAEEIYAMRPDLVLAGTWSDPLAVGLLRDLGIEVVQIAEAEALDDIPDRLAEIGAALGRDEAASRIAASFRKRLAALRSGAPKPPHPVVAFYYPGGWSLGTGTLGHDIISTAGFTNLAEIAGRRGGTRVSLEEILIAGPDLIVSSPTYAGASRAESVARHPALEGVPRAETGAAWVCGTPRTLDAVDEMRALRSALTGG